MIRGQVTGGQAAMDDIKGIGARLQQPLNLKVSGLAEVLMHDFVKPRLKSSGGRLAASLKLVPQSDGGQISVTVTASAPEANFIEYGFEGVESLRGFLRQQKEAWGRPMTAPRAVWVGPHSREVSAPARSYLRAGLADFERGGTLAQGVNEAIGEVIS
jgi:hypothetical protein